MERAISALETPIATPPAFEVEGKIQINVLIDNLYASLEKIEAAMKVFTATGSKDVLHLQIMKRRKLLLMHQINANLERQEVSATLGGGYKNHPYHSYHCANCTARTDSYRLVPPF